MLLRTTSAGLFYWMIVGTFRHVQLNDYFPRYVLPALLLFGVALAMLLVAPLSRHPKVAIGLSTVAFVAGTLVSDGTPSVRRVRSALDRKFGILTPHVITTGATVIAGDYWTVWPAVFHANMQLYERQRRTKVFGFTYRSNPTDPLWLDGCSTENVVLVAPRVDERANEMIATLDVPVTFAAFNGPLAVFIVDTQGTRGHRPPPC